MKSFNHPIPLDLPGVDLFIKRDDLLHPAIPGNKFRKLKYNLVRAKDDGYDTLVTFGGAYSNHIAAVSAAGKTIGLKTIGLIRGEELRKGILENPTLSYASANGMKLEFINRKLYNEKDEPAFIQSLHQQFGNFYLIPEGGTNELAVRGCEEILTDSDISFDYICCPVGTGGTISGLINSAAPHQKVLGFPALKIQSPKREICKFARGGNWEIIDDYEFGGYAKTNNVLIDFINRFKKETGIPLDPVYTGKMMFGVMDLISKGYFPPGSRILAIHTGGLQGIAGMNMKLASKKQTLILI